MASLLQDAPPPQTFHSAHPAHILTLVQPGGGSAQPTCDGCKQRVNVADEARYRCDQCDFDLHIQCSRAPSICTHPLFGGCSFTFTHDNRFCNMICDACGDHALGFVYNSSGGLDIHPCCASLQERIVYYSREFHLNKFCAGVCNLCRQNGPRDKFWTYADGGVVNMHVACLLYGDRTHNPGPGCSRSTLTPGQMNSTPGQITGNGTTGTDAVGMLNAFNSVSTPGQITGNGTTGTDVVGMLRAFNTVYRFGKHVGEIFDLINGDSTDKDDHMATDNEELHDG